MIGRPQGEEFGLALPQRSGEGPRVYEIECDTCGFAPAEQLSIPRGRCPKCHGFAWHRVPQTRGSLSYYATPRRF